MSTDPDSFESAADTTDDDGTFKYYQIAVPQFTFNEVGDDTTHTQKEGSHAAGNSFIRLGCFPDVANPSTGPVGFQNSLDLANIVGKKDAIVAAESGQDVSPATYNGDPNYLLGFADDTRYRTDTVPWKDRQKETLQLLTKGGWWDHSDGNRVSTTKGDKIEIIQGNYKMIVLGRQQDLSDPAKLAANGLIRDVSGGMVEENGPSPTHCIKTIEWTQEEGGTWSVYQNNGIGNVYSSFYGDVGDVFFGQHKESWTGIAPKGFSTSEFYKNSLRQHAVAGYPKLKEDPEIEEYTWAKSITSYTGSSQKSVPSISEHTYADVIDGETHAQRVKSETYANAVTNFTSAASINDIQLALEKFSFTGATQWNIAFPWIFELFLGVKWSLGIDRLEFHNFHNVVNAQKTDAAAINDQFTALRNSLTNAHNGITDLATDIVNVDSRVTNETTQLHAALTQLDGEAVKIGGTYEVLFAEINEGI